jgi:hypothetical protein
MKRKTTEKDKLVAQRYWVAVELCFQRPCILCGHTPALGCGDWHPEDAYNRLVIRAPRGKERHILYPLCRLCEGLPDVYERVERAIRTDFIVLS